jgi:hypothetical protein
MPIHVPPYVFHGGEMMRYFLFACLLVCAALTSVGCIIPAYSSNPQRRVQQELHDSENLRNAEAEWERWWMVDKPSSLTMDRLHGGIM